MEAQEEPLVSILISNYNYGCFLRNSIESALNQTYSNTEVIVVDDGSTDDSREIIASYGNRIIPILKENGSQASTFNAGFAVSCGEWIFFLDSDDVFLPGKVKKVVRLTSENPQIGMVTHNVEYCDTDGALIDFLPPLIRERRFIDDRKRVRRGKVTALMPATSALCFRHDVLGRILPMPEEIRTLEDIYVKLSALSLTPVLQVPEVLARQRIHDRNRYTSKDTSEAALLRRLRCRAEVGFHLRRDYPRLSRLVWKQYGRMLYQLTAFQSEEARALTAEIRSRYNVTERTPMCYFYVAGSFTKAFVRGLLNAKPNP